MYAGAGGRCLSLDLCKSSNGQLKGPLSHSAATISRTWQHLSCQYMQHSPLLQPLDSNRR